MISWLIPLQRVSSFVLWAMLVFFPLLVALGAAVGASLSTSHDAVVVQIVVAALAVATAAGSALVLFPMLAWSLRGGSRPWLDQVADDLGGVARYPSLCWPLVAPHVDAEVDGAKTRIILLRSGGLIGPYRPGDSRLIWRWLAYANVEIASPAVIGVFPAGTRLFVSPGLRGLRPIPVLDPQQEWVLATDQPAVGERVAADPEAQEIASRFRAFPGAGVGATGRRARWQGALTPECTPAALVGVVRNLASFSLVVQRHATKRA